MRSFRERSQELEMMDHPIEEDEAIFQNFEELLFINTHLGGPSHSHAAIEPWIQGIKRPVVADVGFGAGDFLEQSRVRWPHAQLVGIDLMPQALEFSRRRFPELADKVEWRCESHETWMDEAPEVDIVHAALFCHHLTHEEWVSFLRKAARHAKVAVVINDLHRHWFAYHSIRLLTRWFSSSEYTKNDAPLSVLRGFTKQEWHEALQQAGLHNYRIEWKWAFRHVITIFPS